MLGKCIKSNFPCFIFQAILPPVAAICDHLKAEFTHEALGEKDVRKVHQE